MQLLHVLETRQVHVCTFHSRAGLPAQFFLVSFSVRTLDMEHLCRGHSPTAGPRNLAGVRRNLVPSELSDELRTLFLPLATAACTCTVDAGSWRVGRYAMLLGWLLFLLRCRRGIDCTFQAGYTASLLMTQIHGLVCGFAEINAVVITPAPAKVVCVYGLLVASTFYFIFIFIYFYFFMFSLSMLRCLCFAVLVRLLLSCCFCRWCNNRRRQHRWMRHSLRRR